MGLLVLRPVYPFDRRRSAACCDGRSARDGHDGGPDVTEPQCVGYALPILTSGRISRDTSTIRRCTGASHSSAGVVDARSTCAGSSQGGPTTRCARAGGVVDWLHRTALEHLGVEGRWKLTEKSGIQIWVPVADSDTFEQTQRWVETVSRAIDAILALPCKRTAV